MNARLRHYGETVDETAMARNAGVESFRYKSASAEEIIEFMNRTMAGDSVYPDTTPSLRLGEALNVDFSSSACPCVP